jgi:hypothetical protein
MATAKVNNFPIGQLARSTIRLIVQRHHAADLPEYHLSLRRHRQPLVHRATLVGLIVSEGDPPSRSGGRIRATAELTSRTSRACCVEEKRLASERALAFLGSGSVANPYESGRTNVVSGEHTQAIRNRVENVDFSQLAKSTVRAQRCISSASWPSSTKTGERNNADCR